MISLFSWPFPHHLVHCPRQIVNLEECMTLCVSWRSYRCMTIAYLGKQQECRLSATHYRDLNSSALKPHSDSDVFSRESLLIFSSHVPLSHFFYFKFVFILSWNLLLSPCLLFFSLCESYYCWWALLIFQSRVINILLVLVSVSLLFYSWVLLP